MKRYVAQFYFAFRSPYSWIASRLLEERFPNALDRLDYVPFFGPDAHSLELLHNLGGEFLYTPMSKAKHLYILQDIKRLTAKLGYQMAWPIDQDPWWDLPHLAYVMARRLGKGQEFLQAAYRARWERGEDICTAPVIRTLAAEVKIDPEVLVTAPDNPEIRAEGAKALYRAYENDVFGIPFFIFKHEKFWGVDRVEDFAARFAQAITGGEK